MAAVDSSGALGGSGADSRSSFFPGRSSTWSAVAVLVVIVGCVGTVLAARSQSRRNAASARAAFRSSSAEIASRLTLAIQHETDLIVSADGFVAGAPDPSAAKFQHWAQSVHALKRYPEITGLGYAVIVPADKLAAFAKRSVSNPADRLQPGPFRVVPAGRRPFYCLDVGRVGRAGGGDIPAGFDYCYGALGRAVLAARDTGQAAYVPINAGVAKLLSVLAPVYRGGQRPPTDAGRRAALLGWVGMGVVPAVLLHEALAGHPGTAVTFTYDAGGSKASFKDGRVPPHSQSATIDLHNGWTVRTSAGAPATGLFAGGHPSVLLLAGVVISVLVGTLIFVLATANARSLRLVDLKTRQLSHQALHDTLTGLPNRALISDRAEQLLARSRRHGRPAAVLFMDLDGFKNVNDTLGHEAGDQLLQAAADRLVSGLREVDTIGRLGGDEFVVLVDGEAHIEPERVAERLNELMRQPFILASSPKSITISSSVGIAVAAGDGTSASEVLRDADTALYQAKAAGKNCHQIFEPEMQSALLRQHELGLDLRSALSHDQFRLVYQPIYSLGNLGLIGVEALLRWDHPTLGEILPDEFISLLESSGQITEIGRWVLRAACRQMRDWHGLGSDLSLSVNLSARQLDDDAIVTDIRAALIESGLEPSKLTVEITETALMTNLEAAALRLKEIKALQVNVAIDDFGTGYSSLASLQQLPIDTIKIDQAFTAALARSPESDALIKILVQLGDDLGLHTLAEGVETDAQLDYLRAEGIQEVQGFLFSEPLNPQAMQELIAPERPPDPSTDKGSC